MLIIWLIHLIIILVSTYSGRENFLAVLNCRSSCQYMQELRRYLSGR